MPQGLFSALQVTNLLALDGALALLMGSWASERWLAGADSGWGAEVRAQACRVRRASFVVGALAMVFALWMQAAEMADVPLLASLPALPMVLRQTHFGHVAMIGLAAWLLLAGTAWQAWATGRGARTGIAFAALLVVAWSRSAVSHAAQAGDLSPDIAVDMLHLIATGLWVGMVWAGARLTLPSPDASAPDRSTAARWIGSLSAVATACLAGVLATGLYKVWRAVPEWRGLFETTYGELLAFKLALVAVAIGLGGFNRLRVLPGLLAELQQARGPHGNWRGRFLAVLRIEAAVLGLVLLGAIWLSGTEPV